MFTQASLRPFDAAVAIAKFNACDPALVQFRDDARFGRLPKGRHVCVEEARNAYWDAKDLGYVTFLAEYKLRRMQAHNASIGKAGAA